MIAQEKYCIKFLNDAKLMGELVKKLNCSMRLQSLELALTRKSPSIRKNFAFIETLKDAGYKEEEIFEQEDVKQLLDTI